MIVSDTAIILHGRKYSDTSKILQVYTQNHGKISLIAKGVRSSKSSLGGNVEPLRCSALSWYHYANRDLHLLKSAESAIHLHHIINNYDALITAMCIVEVLSSTQEPEEANPLLFKLTLDTLSALNEYKGVGNEYAHVLCYLYYLAEIMGFAFHTDSCPVTGEIILPEDSESFFLSFNEGAILSHSATHHGKTGLLLNSSIVSILQIIGTLKPEDFKSLSINLADQFTLLDMFQRYFSFHSHKSYRWKSLPPGFPVAEQS